MIEIISLLSIFVFGILTGVLVGLFPVLPVWLGPLLLLPFIDYIDLAHILVFFLTVAIGSQYFGSVATLLTGIPGETSALSYSEEIRSLAQGQRLNAVVSTAWASVISSLSSIAAVTLLFALAGPWVASLVSMKIQWLVLLACCLVIVLASNHASISFILLLLGILAANKTHPDLPSWAISIQNNTQDITVFLITLGAVIVPSVLFATEYISRPIKNININSRSLPDGTIKNAGQGGLLGFLVGFMPGPAAMMSSILAYRLPKKNIVQGVVRAEAANNSAMIAETVPFMALGIPINTTAVLVYSLISIKLISWPSAVFGSWIGMPVYAWVMISAALASLIFFFLATRFLPFYVRLLDILGNRVHWIWGLLLLVMFAIDYLINLPNPWLYPLWTAVMIGLGSLLWHFRVSGISLIFGYVLGDRIIWASMQFVEYYL